MNSLVDNPALRALLDRLHAASEAQEPEIEAYYQHGAARPTGYEDEAEREFWRDKLVALDRDKAELCYSLARASGAGRIVEAGTSFGVSTLYLAAAVHDNGGGRVITCDIEATKAATADLHLAEAGLADQVEIRLGDVRRTLIDLEPPVDLLLLDIWAPVAAEVITLVGPRIRVGGMVIADNTTVRRQLYTGLLSYLESPDHGFTVLTLPYSGGLALAVKTSA